VTPPLALSPDRTTGTSSSFFAIPPYLLAKASVPPDCGCWAVRYCSPEADPTVPSLPTIAPAFEITTNAAISMGSM